MNPSKMAIKNKNESRETDLKKSAMLVYPKIGKIVITATTNTMHPTMLAQIANLLFRNLIEPFFAYPSGISEGFRFVSTICAS